MEKTSRDVAVDAALRIIAESEAFALVCIRGNERAMSVHCPDEYMLRLFGAMEIVKSEMLGNIRRGCQVEEDESEKD